MILRKDNLFLLSTKNTSYGFVLLPSGHLEHLCYTSRIEISEADPIKESVTFQPGNTIAYSEEYPQLVLENLRLEMSSYGKGDTREPFVEIIHSDGSGTCDFLFDKATITKGRTPLSTLPCSYDETGEVEQLDIELLDKNYGVRLIMTYCVYEDCDVITRSSKIINEGKYTLRVNRLMSTQVDFDHNQYKFTNFAGAWAREMSRYDRPCHQGKVVNSSYVGTSSSRNNPFVMLSELDTTEEYGACYGFNLIYSGNHYEAVDVNSFGKARFVSGINPTGFLYHLSTGEELEAPEAVMTFSMGGYQGMSHNMHKFIKEHIVRGVWKKKERPILLNSWEAAYFNFDEGKLLKMAKTAKESGIELFVMDDGWFGERNDDTSSLGDWDVNRKKLPRGVKGLADKINEMGMEFGIWVEPEMISENSNLYRAHPDWAVKVPGMPHSTGRNQMILDLTKEEVQDYIITEMKKLFLSANISYVKWDMNRIFSDFYSTSLSLEHQQEFAHRYVLGLYHVMDEIVTAFPEILFEGCCAGGNRFDLGILCYMPQIWASDNTDAICRAKIQTGYSYGYPMSVISAHVSACPNHQTLRTTSIETRFNVACFGILGYECNLSDLPKEDLNAVKAQISLYKKYRKVLQFGDYYRIANGDNTDYTNGVYQWMTVSPDKETAVGFTMQGLVQPNTPYSKFKGKGLDNEKQYHFYNRLLKYNVKLFGDLINTASPIRVKNDSVVHNMIAKVVKMDGEVEDYYVKGSVINHAGIKLKQNFCATGYNAQVRYYQDFSSRIYIMEEAN